MGQMRFEQCRREKLDDGYWLCEDAHLTSGEVCSVYFGPGGIYVISELANLSASELFHRLRDLFGIVHVRLYLQGLGLYFPLTDSVGNEFSEADLVDDINFWLDSRYLYKETTLFQFLERLELEDGKSRGYKIQSDGSRYLYRRGQFVIASPHDSDFIFSLALFGGSLGLHRFAQGKWFTGMVYFFTCGTFLIGWFADVLFLFFGIQRDKQARLFFPLSHRNKKFLLLPFGLALNVLFLVIYLFFVNAVASAVQSGVVEQAQNADPQMINNIIEFLTKNQSR